MIPTKPGRAGSNEARLKLIDSGLGANSPPINSIDAGSISAIGTPYCHGARFHSGTNGARSAALISQTSSAIDSME